MYPVMAFVLVMNRNLQ